MVGVYIRTKVDGKRTFRSALEVPGEYEYWLKSAYDGRQKWHRVGRYDGVKKAKLLLEREQERKEAARKYGLVAPPAEGHVTVAEGVRKYIERKVTAGKRPGTITAYKFTLGLFQEFCPHLYIEQVTGDTLLDFAAWCRKRGDGERTVANRFVDIASLVKFHGKTGLVPKSDWPKYTERRVESYTQEELDKFYGAAKTDKEQILLYLLIHSGFRIVEIAHLTFGDVDFAGNKLHVEPKPQWNWVPKTHECRTVRVPGKVIAALSNWREADPDQSLVFPSTVGKPDGHLQRIVVELGECAGITGRCDAHKLRATFATRNYGRFRPQDVQRMLGHRNIETTMRYLAVSDLDDAEFVKKIEAA
jgi:integrase